MGLAQTFTPAPSPAPCWICSLLQRWGGRCCQSPAVCSDEAKELRVTNRVSPILASAGCLARAWSLMRKSLRPRPPRHPLSLPAWWTRMGITVRVSLGLLALPRYPTCPGTCQVQRSHCFPPFQAPAPGRRCLTPYRKVPFLSALGTTGCGQGRKAWPQWQWVEALEPEVWSHGG